MSLDLPIVHVHAYADSVMTFISFAACFSCTGNILLYCPICGDVILFEPYELVTLHAPAMAACGDFIPPLVPLCFGLYIST
jgi:hypothetical protein